MASLQVGVAEQSRALVNLKHAGLVTEDEGQQDTEKANGKAAPRPHQPLQSPMFRVWSNILEEGNGSPKDSGTESQYRLIECSRTLSRCVD
jgi:hypothetical protein